MEKTDEQSGFDACGKGSVIPVCVIRSFAERDVVGGSLQKQ
jgi:hypothetical protein